MRAAEISIADSIVPSVKEAAAYIVNQAEGTVHYYMEGMDAPMGAFRNYGHEARAIEIVDRSLGEREPGVYTGRVKIPVEGTYDVAFMMDTPRFLHCFSATVEPNPEMQATTAPMVVEYQIAERRVPVGESTTVKFKLTDPRTGLPRNDIPDVTVLYYGADGRGRRVVPAKALGDGLYEADVKVDRVTTYYVFVGSQSEKLKYNDLPFASLMGMPAPAKKPAKAKEAAPQAKAEAGHDGDARRASLLAVLLALVSAGLGAGLLPGQRGAGQRRRDQLSALQRLLRGVPELPGGQRRRRGAISCNC